MPKHAWYVLLSKIRMTAADVQVEGALPGWVMPIDNRKGGCWASVAR